MKNRLLLLLGLLFLAAFLLIPGMACKQKRGITASEKTSVEMKAPEDKSQQALLETLPEIGDISLDLSMDYAKLKSLLRENPRPGSKTNTPYTNAVLLQWNRGVSAIFLGDDPQDDQKPVGIRIATSGTKFQGSICGVRLGDSLEQASAAMRECGCHVAEKHFKSGTWYVDVKANCRLNQSLSMHFSAGRIISLLLWDRRYIAQPQFP